MLDFVTMSLHDHDFNVTIKRYKQGVLTKALAVAVNLL